MKYRFCAALTAILLICTLLGPAAAEPAAVEIYTPEQLQAMAENPSGSYILMKDLDMSGVIWSPIDFAGSFDGNSHAILNLTLTQPSEKTAKCYDGNTVAYEPEYYGLFGLLENATVQNLTLVNVRCSIESDTPCIVGSIAGYASHSLITGCTVSGQLELHAHNGMFGVGGVVGYGTGSIENCRVDMTLVCTDTDSKNMDEQFLGGAYAAGFLDVRNCRITVDGYVSEHGYTHNGGITGLFMRWPIGDGIDGEITGNHVAGKITFFENNSDRRAYCSAYAGEILGRYCTVENNTQDFARNETWDYSVQLHPHGCEQPVFGETVIPSGCDTFGYTLYSCTSCDYGYTDHYTLYSHTVSVWETVNAATTEAEGLSQGNCDLCGAVCERTEPLLIPEPTAAPTEAPTQAPTQPEPPATQPTAQPSLPQGTPEPTSKPDLRPLWITIAAAAALIILILLLKKPRRKGKYEKV